MSKSDELKREAQAEDNDLKAMGLYRKAARESRFEAFSAYIEPLLKKGINVTEITNQGKFILEPTEFGTIDYYPKANKVLIRKNNQWYNQGLSWIIRMLLTPK